MKKQAIAIGSILAIALTGCAAGTSSDTSSSIDTDDLLTTTPAATGELDLVTWNLPFGEPASIDPIKSFNYPENTVVANLCEGLMQLQPDFSIEPGLAEKVDTPDDLTYIYTIRQGVEFWDGAEMTADDVVFSLGRHADANEGSYWAGGLISNIASIEKTDDWEVTVTLTEPDATFNSYMVTPAGTIVQQAHREAAGDSYGNPTGQVMCTGPYSVGEWDQGQSISLIKNENYWNTAKQAKTTQVDINFIVDSASIATALDTGAIDGSYDVPLGALPTLENSEAGTLYLGNSLQLVAIIGTGNGAFADPAVRQALMMATDRDAIAATVFEGTATASRSLVPNNGWAYGDSEFTAGRDDLAETAIDIEGAKKVLESATVDITQPISIVYPSERTYYADIISEIANGAREIGLTVEPEGVPSAQFGAFFSDPAAREGHDAFVTYNYMDVPDPLSFLRAIVGSDGSQNYSEYSNPEIDSLLSEAAAATDESERALLVNQVQEAAMEDLPWIPIVDPAVRLFMADGVTGAPASFVYLYYPWAADLGASGE
ncbi:peptide/nickel transport system substrate-binding protein [Salinibacterium amurskyense]|uniref:Peptide/nickel transport system substrate-binding protein n=1 Tax=Salinibacterium amurskyense TaxID=205941 RepID=A0A2M9D2I5_9MICO|nr:ABC transporter substrate-binding protein [Salinibacterium amurskyense]PJJ78285.1 peptide/nickel transport system substrate-binding protein [Salinibacterium amurskyense]RLQ80398.1 ABC transporter substrate-binding protein [Salinibacterium amurskyense]GHD83522.1 diguanylate phosphodiesterase [Salinibacterium amurskyense]